MSSFHHSHEHATIDVPLCSAANGTGLYANLPSTLTFFPLRTLASSQLVASVQDEATRLMDAPETSPLARRQYAIEREWLTADDIATIEIVMHPGGGSTLLPPTPGSEYISLYPALVVCSHARLLSIRELVVDVLPRVAPLQSWFSGTCIWSTVMTCLFTLTD